MIGHAMPLYSATVTLLAVALYFFLATRVAAARRRFGVGLPATSGHPDFERVFRTHSNMLEWLPIFLASLWLCAIFLDDFAAAAIGLVWVFGRAVYAFGYARSVEGRLPGFFIQALAGVALFLGAAAGIAMQWAGA